MTGPMSPLPATGAPSARRDRRLLMGARTARGFGAGALSIVLAVDLAASGYSPIGIGVILGLALGGAAAWALAVPRIEFRWHRRAVLAASALALALGGALLWWDVANPALLLGSLLLGGIVAGGADVSPLGALEQAALAGTAEDRGRTEIYAMYNLLGYVGIAMGALAAGPLSGLAGPTPGVVPPGLHDATFLFYGLLGLGLVPTYLSLSREIDRRAHRDRSSPLSAPSRPIVYSLSALFAVDAFAGGLIVNSLVVYYFSTHFHPGVDTLGAVFFLSNLAAGLSLVLAAPLARRYGLVNTMVFSHIPSNVFLILLVVAPSFLVASVLWIARATLSQMDVPTRQSYLQAVVPASDRGAAAGYTTAARSCQAFGAPVTGTLLSAGGPWVGAPFALAGCVKLGYDVAIYSRFRRLRPPEELVDRDGARAGRTEAVVGGGVGRDGRG
ncbi:MAG: MFS transporter [Thermoplasmata archaeon]|nr:MFS transporter [Thermoplasmata archaeon]